LDQCPTWIEGSQNIEDKQNINNRALKPIWALRSKRNMLVND